MPLMQDPETGIVYLQEGDQFTAIDPEDIPAAQRMVKADEIAQGVDSWTAGALSMSDRVLGNIMRKMGVTDEDMGIKPGAMESLDKAHPIATAIGDVAPYIAAAPAIMATGGILAPMAAGGITAAAISDPGNEIQDAALGALSGGSAGVYNAGKNIGNKLWKYGRGAVLDSKYGVGKKAEVIAKLNPDPGALKRYKQKKKLVEDFADSEYAEPMLRTLRDRQSKGLIQQGLIPYASDIIDEGQTP